MSGKATLRSLLTHPSLPLVLLLAFNALLGWHLVTDYGESWDEHLRYDYAVNSLNAYRGIRGDVRDGKGPFFVMLAKIGGDLLYPLRHDWLWMDAWHYVIFLTFLLGVYFVYRLGLRFAGRWGAFGAALLFDTQPLFWGHAFMNPKDIPFMVFFLASVEMGLRMADTLRDRASEGAPAAQPGALKMHLTQEWRALPPSRRRALVGSALLVGLIPLFLLLTRPLVAAHIERWVRLAYAGQAGGAWAERLMRNKAQISPDLYVQKAWKLYLRLAWMGSFALLLAWIAGAGFSLPRTRRCLWRGHVLPFLRKAGWALRQPSLLLAGLFLGFVAAIRVLGPVSGGIAALYLLLKDKRRPWYIVLAYGLVGLVTMYALWPGLWEAPLQRLWGSLTTASNFPWEGKILFQGVEYAAGDLPGRYLPVLLSIQLTPALLFLAAAGLFLAAHRALRGRGDWVLPLLAGLWFFLPFLYIVTQRPKIYDNFRHFFFILPPLFAFAALALEALFRRVRRPLLRALVLVVLVAPSLWTAAKLHPYEYVYYNALAGGTGGAFRRYEMDYWGISFREATAFVNRVAPPGATIVVGGAPHLVAPYAREDLSVLKYDKEQAGLYPSPTYALLLSKHDKDVYVFPEAEVLYTVQRDGAILAVVKAAVP